MKTVVASLEATTRPAHMRTTASGSLALSGVRIRAHLNKLPDEQQWQRLNPLENYRHYLLAAQQTGLGSWLGGFENLPNVHALEGKLRLQYRQELKKIAGWAPQKTGDAVVWFAHLPCLAYLTKSAEGQPPLILIGEDSCIAATEQAMQRHQQESTSPIETWFLALENRHLVHLPQPKVQKLTRLMKSVLPDASPDSAEKSLDSSRFTQLRQAVHHFGFSDSSIVAYAAIQFWLYRRLRAELVPRMLFHETEV